ncbi:PREDICTED: uncharacterized protein LOC109167249 [Ipomoea nil]|uniref:uncharacterized protein LOC109167249 n=1 Tax=Ipomoea nil TaxID=35883 RepID=UPI000900F1C6|nr:PREDICTED: uncharacterized protein LOC109167249 [Ipomoea nil]
MEGVGARFGRSSSRYGPATVFTGPVRKWKRKWVHVSPPSSGNSNHQSHQAATNVGANGSNGSYLLLLKWTPITPSQNGNNANNSNGAAAAADKNEDSKSSAKDDAVAAEVPLKRKFKYIPIAVLEEQKSSELEDEANQIESETNGGKPASKTDGFHEKPDINDVPMEDNQASENDIPERQDLNESTLDLSLG